MLIFITGSNGFLGAALAKRLVKQGHHVRCLIRQGSDRGRLDGAEIEWVVGDVTQPSTLPAAVKNCEVVYHLAGLRRAPAREPFIQVNAEGTRAVCEAMLSGGCRRLVYCGSLAASGPSTPEQPKIESDPLTPQEWYGESKALGEQIAFSYADRLEVTTARPARVLGPGDDENLPFFKLVKRGYRVELKGAPRPLSMVDVDDVVELLLLLADRKEAVGEAFFVARPEAVSLSDLQTLVADALAVKVRTVAVSPSTVRSLGALADGISLLTGRRLPLNRKLARQLLAPAWTCSPKKAEQVLGFRAALSIADSIRRSAAWYSQRGWI